MLPLPIILGSGWPRQEIRIQSDKPLTEARTSGLSSWDGRRHPSRRSCLMLTQKCPCCHLDSLLGLVFQATAASLPDPRGTGPPSTQGRTGTEASLRAGQHRLNIASEAPAPQAKPHQRGAHCSWSLTRSLRPRPPPRSHGPNPLPQGPFRGKILVCAFPNPKILPFHPTADDVHFQFSLDMYLQQT